MAKASRRGMILILSSPSGAGKTTLTRMLMQDKALDLTLSISVTTRPRRSSEVDGIHYRFVDRREFERMKKGGDLLEWAEVHGNGYGTPRAPGREGAGRGTRHAVRRRLAGRAAGARAARRRRRLHLRPAALDAGIARKARAAGRGFGRHHRRAARQCEARDRTMAQLPLRRRQRRPAARLSATSSRSSPPSG